MKSSHSQESYLKYKKILKRLDNKFVDNLKVVDLTRYFVADFCYNYKDKSYLKKFVSVVRHLFFIPKVIDLNTSSYSVLGWSVYRSDYDKLINAYLGRLPHGTKKICLSNVQNGWKLYANYLAFRTSLRITIYIKGITLKERMFIFLSCFTALNFVFWLRSKNNKINFNVYYSFNPAFSYESIFSLFIKNKGIPTYSLQHAMYYDFKNGFPFDVINYENLNADTLLCWGSFTKKQIGKLLPEDVKIEVFGNPYISSLVLNNKLNRIDNKILICLPRNQYKKEAEFLLNIANEISYDYDITIKAHPSYDSNTIKKIKKLYPKFVISEIDSITDELTRPYSIFIGFNSSSLFEASIHDLRVFQFICGNDEFIDAGFLTFGSSRELINLIENTKKASVSQSLKNFYFGSC